MANRRPDVTVNLHQKPNWYHLWPTSKFFSFFNRWAPPYVQLQILSCMNLQFFSLRISLVFIRVLRQSQICSRSQAVRLDIEVARLWTWVGTSLHHGPPLHLQCRFYTMPYAPPASKCHPIQTQTAVSWNPIKIGSTPNGMEWWYV